MSVTRADLIGRLAAMAGIARGDAELVLKVVLDEIGAGLVEGHRVELRGFGIFERKEQPARLGRHPRSGEELMTPAKRAVHFKPAKAMHQLLNDDPDARMKVQEKRDAVVRQRDDKAGQPSLF